MIPMVHVMAENKTADDDFRRPAGNGRSGRLTSSILLSHQSFIAFPAALISIADKIALDSRFVEEFLLI